MSTLTFNILSMRFTTPGLTRMSGFGKMTQAIKLLLKSYRDLFRYPYPGEGKTTAGLTFFKGIHHF